MLIKTLLLFIFFISSCSPDSDKPDTEVKTAIKPKPFKSKSLWSNIHKDIILASIPDKNIYQIKVLPQAHNECSMHDKRNLLFTMAMFDDEQKNFLKEYKRILDKDHPSFG